MRDYFLVDVIFKGGILMWPIMLCSIIGLAIIIERFFALRRADIDTREFMDVMRQLLRQNRIREAIEDAGRFEIPRLERYLSALATCSNIAPLLGLLGTVQGLIKAFGQIQLKGGQVKPSDLAEGVGNALIPREQGCPWQYPLFV